MTTSILDRVPVDRITAKAREVHFWQSVLLLIAAVLYGLGWLVAKVLTVLWLALTWSWAAMAVGWQEARNPVRERIPAPLVVPGPPGQPVTSSDPFHRV